MKILDLLQFGIDNLKPHVSSIDSKQEVTSLSCHQLRVWNDYVGDIITGHVVSSSTALGFLTNMSEEHISTSPSATQVKNWQKTVSTEEKLYVINRLEKGEQTVD